MITDRRQVIIIITLFKCQVYLALRHTHWGHGKLKLIQIKFNHKQYILYIKQTSVSINICFTTE